MDIHSAKIVAIDFAEEDDIEDYVTKLEEKTLLKSMDEGTPHHPLGNFAKSFDHLGVIEPNTTDSFDVLYVSIVRFGSIPDAAALVLRGEINQCSNEPEVTIESQRLQNELKEVWGGIFDGFPSSIKTGSPQTFLSAQIEVSGLDEAFQMPDIEEDVGKLREYPPLVESLREESFCRSLGIKSRGLMSIEAHREEYLMLTAQTTWTSSDSQVRHGQYVVIEFLPEGSRLFADFELENIAIPPMGISKSAMRVQQMLPSIFYYYWFQNQVGYQHQELKMNLRNLPVAIDNIEEIEEIVDSAQEQRSEFYRIYTKFLDRVDSADALLEQMNSSAAMEAGLPLLPDQQPFVRSEIDGVEYSFDFKSGILNQIITDTRSKMENAERQYSRLQERYEIVLEELSQQFDLTISKQNRELTESSVELQEEMKGLNESSLQLQKEVGTLNRWVIVLTLILVGQAFGLFSLTVKVAVDIYQYLSIHIM